MNNPLVNNAPKYRLKIVSGPDKGAEYQMISDKISIGRDADNDIVITDPKCSRKHVVLYAAPSGLQVVNISQQNKVTIDGIEAENALVEAGSRIGFGGTKIEVIGLSPAMVGQSESDLDTGGFLPPLQKSRKKTKFYLILLSVGGLLVWLLNMSSDPKEEVNLDTPELAEERVMSIKEQENELIRAQQAKGINTPEYREAQALYIQGFRDYREGHFARSVDYFSGALSLFPNHELAQRYLKLARTKQDELIQKTLLEANRYFEQKMFSKAMSAYRSVMILINDSSNPVYREASERFNQCSLLIKEGL